MKIIITGASKGLGRFLAERFSARNSVGVLARSAAPLADLCERLNVAGTEKRAFFRACDLTAAEVTRDAIAALIGDMGGVDLLINNASHLVIKGLLDMSGDEWMRSLATSATSAFLCTQAVAPTFIKQGGGQIINISSLSSRIPLERGSSYSASKHALNGFSASMVDQLHGYGIKVCTIYPGAFVVDPASSDWKMPAEEVYRACEYAAAADPKAFVEEIVVRPVRWPD